MKPLYLTFGTENPQLFHSKEELLKELSGELIDEHLDNSERSISQIVMIDEDITSVAGRWVNVSEDMWKEAEPIARKYLVDHFTIEWGGLERDERGKLETYLWNNGVA